MPTKAEVGHLSVPLGNNKGDRMKNRKAHHRFQRPTRREIEMEEEEERWWGTSAPQADDESGDGEDWGEDEE